MAAKKRQSEEINIGQRYLGNVYAKALLGVTEAAGTTNAVLAEFDSLIQDVLDRLPQFDATLSSRRVAFGEKHRILDKAFQGKMSETLLNFLKVVARHDRLDCLRAIHRSAHTLYDQLRGRVAVDVITAEPISKDLLDLVASKLRAKMGRDVDLHPQVNPEVLGGLVIRVGDTIFDGSVARQLEQMRETAIDQTLKSFRAASDRFMTVG